jgi:hypothetical protein
MIFGFSKYCWFLSIPWDKIQIFQMENMPWHACSGMPRISKELNGNLLKDSPKQDVSADPDAKGQHYRLSPGRANENCRYLGIWYAP